MDPAGRATRGDLRELRAEFAGLDDRALVAEVRAAPARGGAGVALFPPLPRDRAVVVLDGLGSGWRAALDGLRDDAQLAVLLENLDPDDRARGV